MNKIQEIIEKYNLKENSYYPDTDPYDERKKDVEFIINEWPEKGYPPPEAFLPNEYKILKSKWEDYIEPGYYGFALEPPCPKSWYNAVDDLLSYIKEEFPDFKIFQIKIKFGGIRIYLKDISKEIHEEIVKLEGKMYDQKLVF